MLIFQCTWSLIQLYYYLQPVPIYRTIEKRQNVGCQSSLIAVASIWSRIGGPFSLSTDQMEWRKKPIPLGHETSFCLHFGLIPTLIERRRNRRSRKVQCCQLITSFCEYLDSSTFEINLRITEKTTYCSIWALLKYPKLRTLTKRSSTDKNAQGEIYLLGLPLY